MRVRLAGAIAMTIGGLAMAVPEGARGADPGEQIAALQAIKRSLSPAERKLDSRIAVDLRRRRRLKSGLAEVDIVPTAPDVDLTERLTALGATVRYASPRSGDVRAGVPERKLTTVAGWSDVKRVDAAADYPQRPLRRAAREQGRSAPRASTRRCRRRTRSPASPPRATARTPPTPPARRERVTGVGTKLCALSDGVASLAASQAAGELPAVDVLPGQAGGGDEGTAMLQIMHDLAPGAELGFATAFTSAASFADNIRKLRFDADCDVIVDDILYYNEAAFQDGPIAQAVNAVTADGALYFSSAGNEGNTLDGTSGHYEGDFVGSGQRVGKIFGEAHDFDPGPGRAGLQPAVAGQHRLGRDDVLGRAARQGDLRLRLLRLRQRRQPPELLPERPGRRRRRLRALRHDRARQRLPARRRPLLRRAALLRASRAFGGRFKASADGLPAWATPGVTRGHSAAADAFSVAAAPAEPALRHAAGARRPAEPARPVPRGLHGQPAAGALHLRRPAADLLRRRRHARAAGAPEAGDHRRRRRRDVGPGFARFFGTSAAAPHAAAIAGLVLSGNPTATETELREAFEATALDLAPAGVDNRTGHGIIRADRVLEYTGATPQPLVRAQQPQLGAITGDGDAYLEPGETATLQLPVTNVGDGTATGISVTATTRRPAGGR